jgi:TPR repeat protein
MTSCERFRNEKAPGLTSRIDADMSRALRRFGVWCARDQRFEAARGGASEKCGKFSTFAGRQLVQAKTPTNRYYCSQWLWGVFQYGSLARIWTSGKFAADQGVTLAQYSLGVFYQQGRGGLTKNDEEAARLLTEALAH